MKLKGLDSGYRVEDDYHLLCEDIEDQLVPFEQVPRPLQERQRERVSDRDIVSERERHRERDRKRDRERESERNGGVC